MCGSELLVSSLGEQSVPAAIDRWVLDMLDELQSTTRQRWSALTNPPQPSISWGLTGRTAGKADWSKCRILLNPQLMDFGRHHVRQTLAHEYAHLVCIALHGPGAGRFHDSKWRKVALELGCDGDRTHDLPMKRARRSREFAYRVSGEVHWLGIHRHNALQQGKRSYRVRSTGDEITADAHSGQWRWKT